MRRPVIFDLDGTLVNSVVTCVDILNAMLADRGSDRRIDCATAAPFMSRGGTAMVRGLLAGDCGSAADDLADFRARYAGWAGSADCLFQGVARGLAELRGRGHRLAICSNKPQNLCEKVLAESGLAPLFEAVVGGAPGLRPKPAPDLLDRALEALSVAPADCLYVGDSELDHAAATARLVPYLHVTYGYGEEGWDAPGLLRFDSFAAVVGRVLRWEAGPVRRAAA